MKRPLNPIERMLILGLNSGALFYTFWTFSTELVPIHFGYGLLAQCIYYVFIISPFVFLHEKKTTFCSRIIFIILPMVFVGLAIYANSLI